MPIYEYTCRKCGAHLEVMQKISDKPLARHSRCGGKLEKEWSRTGFQFKGTGWYVTDYAGRKAEAKEDTESKSDSSETKATASEQKTSTTESKTKKAGAKETKSASSKETKSASSPGGGD
ncbi:MAG TPA: FmdB family zinc ribbon protein [Pyrinomonadaceae bacterium]|jgi:putative FmdB family regulatory protein|nr:FmdB family zinc ribbon protein [Pyrinomonadaceae bacterium]